MGFGGNLRQEHPAGFFWWGIALCVALVTAGSVMLNAASTTAIGNTPAVTNKAVGTTGGILAGVGALLLVVVLVLGTADLARARGKGRAKQTPEPLAQPDPSAEKWWTRQLQGSAQGSVNLPPADRAVKILMVGYSASGKTLMLASLYHYFAHGTKAGIRFTTDDESNNTLVGYATSIRDPQKGLPAGTLQTKRWTFTVRVESDTQESDAFTLEYLDYAGGNIDRILNASNPSVADEIDAELKSELKSTDVLMGVLDGENLAKLMTGDYEVDIVGDIDRLLNILIRTGHRNIHLVITKWDFMRGAGGAYYTISQVRHKLDQVSNAFQSFRLSPKIEGSMRIIPVSALGVNGFATYDPSVESRVTRQPGISWTPWNVQVPFFSAVPDILASDVPKLATEHPGVLSKIGLAVFKIVGVIDVKVPLGIIDLKVPAVEVLQRVINFVRGRNQGGTVPASLTAESALSYVLNESYAALHTFEAQTPDSRAKPGPYG